MFVCFLLLIRYILFLLFCFIYVFIYFFIHLKLNVLEFQLFVILELRYTVLSISLLRRKTRTVTIIANNCLQGIKIKCLPWNCTSRPCKLSLQLLVYKFHDWQSIFLLYLQYQRLSIQIRRPSRYVVFWLWV